MKILTRRKKNYKVFDFSNYFAKSKYCNDSNKLVAGKMKYETKGVAVEEFGWLQPKIYSFFVDDSSEHKKAKGGNKNAVAKISRNEYVNVLLNKNSVRHSMNRIQSKNHKIWTYEIDKISLSYFDDKIYFPNNGYDWLGFRY